MSKEINPESLSENSLHPYIIKGNTIGYTLDLTVTRYRSLPLSCVNEFELKVDGEVVDPINMTFCINRKRFMIAQLKDLWAEYWNLNEKAQLVVLKNGGLEPGEHKVELTLIMRVPYVYANDTFDIRREDTANFTFAIDDASCTKTLVLQQQ